MKSKTKTILAVAAASVLAVGACTEISPDVYDKGFSMSSSALSYIGDGEQQVLKITTDKPWSIDLGDCSWLSASKLSGESTDKIILTCSQNPSTADSRSTTITVTSGTVTKHIEVTQEKYTMWITLENDGETFIADNLSEQQQITLELRSNIEWTVSSPEDITVEPASGKGNATLTITVNNGNIKEQNKLSAVVVSGGEDLECKYWINQVCSYSNTYVVKEGGHYSFPACKPDGTKLDAASADWMMSSTSGLISGVALESDRVSFDMSSAAGYAVIVLLNSASEVVWSYMIWGAPELAEITIGDDEWLNMNLGAWKDNLPWGDFGNKLDESAIGTYYQWGRKDPFPGPKTASILKPAASRESTPFTDAHLAYAFNTAVAADFVADAANLSEEAALAHPWIYYTSNRVEDAGTPTLWADAEKTVNDPCPSGYKVPSIDQTNTMIQTVTGSWTKKEMSKDGYSRLYTSGSGVEFFIPSTGYMRKGCHYSSGRMAGYWTSTYSKTANAYRNYDFNKTTTDGDTKKEDIHTNGYGVRCVKVK